MLTGKAKEDFEKWLDNQDSFLDIHCDYNGTFLPNNINHFNELPFSMQYGVYVDFFDSVNISIKCGDVTFEIYMPESDINGIATERAEARTKAIEKACEIYNSKK